MLGMIVTQLNVFGYSKGTLQQRSLSFEENKGQVSDQHGTSRPDIQYSLSAPGMTVFIGDGQLHYQFYKGRSSWTAGDKMDMLQCVVGKGFTPFGSSQLPALADYADGADTMKFLLTV